MSGRMEAGTHGARTIAENIYLIWKLEKESFGSLKAHTEQHTSSNYATYSQNSSTY